MRGSGGLRGGLFAAGLLALAACDPVQTGGVDLPPPPPLPEVGADATALAPASRELAAYYQRVQNDLLARGLLRRDGGGADTPFTERQLVENFVRIALFEEFSTVGGRIVARESESRLHRWEQPVRMTIEFGDSVPAEQRIHDRNAILSYARRLSDVSGHPIRATDANPNYHVLILNEAERKAIGPRLLEIVPGLGQSAIDTVQDIPRTTFCLVFAVDPQNDGAYTRAVAIIRGEHPDLLRLSCIHEEIAQGMGLSNDSPAARPTIFNDDEEFALLTRHDELLLQILYDDRLRPGMTVNEARPIVETIVSELLGGPV